MSTIAENLQKLRDVKLALKESINAKNAGAIDDSTPFSAYTSAIDTIPSGGGDGKIKWTNGLKFSEDINDQQASELLEKIDFSNTTSFRGLFSSCSILSNAPYIDTSKVTDMSCMFNNCYNLQNTVPLYDTSNVTDMSFMFSSCGNLKSVPTFDTSKVTDMRMTFFNCASLTEIPMFDTSKVTNMSNTFGCCNNVKSFPLLDTSSVTNMYSTFGNCLGCETIPEYNVSNVDDMSYMFNSSSFKLIPKLNSVKNLTIDYMFAWNNALTKVTDLDVSSVTSCSGMFDGCENLRYCMLRNLGKPEGSYTIDFSQASNYGVEDETNELTANARQSLIDTLLTYSFDRTAAGYTDSFTVTLSETTKGLLTEEEIAQITAKGFTIS